MKDNNVILYYKRPKKILEKLGEEVQEFEKRYFELSTALDAGLRLAYCAGYEVRIVVNGVEVLHWRENFILELLE